MKLLKSKITLLALATLLCALAVGGGIWRVSVAPAHAAKAAAQSTLNCETRSTTCTEVYDSEAVFGQDV